MCLVVTLANRALCFVFDFYVSDSRTLFFLFDCYVSQFVHSVFIFTLGCIRFISESEVNCHVSVVTVKTFLVVDSYFYVCSVEIVCFVAAETFLWTKREGCTGNLQLDLCPMATLCTSFVMIDSKTELLQSVMFSSERTMLQVCNDRFSCSFNFRVRFTLCGKKKRNFSVRWPTWSYKLK